MTRSCISVAVSGERFDAFAGSAARDLGADLLLSAPGYPAQTTPVVGVQPVGELIFTDQTTPDDIKHFCFDTPGLALGFISYTYGMRLRGIPSDKPVEFPLGHLKKYAATVEYDGNGQAIIDSDDQALAHALAKRLKTTSQALQDTAAALPEGPPVLSLSRTDYEAGVRATLTRILSGHTYQLNLSTRFSWDSPDLDPLSLFMGLYTRHPAPFYAWFTSGRHCVISTSPERFLRVDAGHVLSQPIKGTLHFDDFSPDLIHQLTGSAKESAELSMIVDLIRNDISANCEYGSVQVDNHKSVFAVDNLLQMYTDVHGALRKNRDCLDLFLDAFPGGSVTGCPKLSSMAIIEALEPHERGVYCGSMVVIRDKENMDSSIAIRTATFDTKNGQLRAFAGSGIVVDSDPAKEYEETLAKAEKFLARRDI